MIVICRRRSGMPHRSGYHRARYLGFCVAVLAIGIALPADAGNDDIVIAITGGKFVPSEVPVPAGKKVKLIVRNQDNTMSEFESTDFHREKMVTPGSEINEIG